MDKRHAANQARKTIIWKIIHRSSTIWKIALAVGLSWDAAKLTGTGRPFFAPLAAILCVQVTVEQSVLKGYQRVIGIIGGVLLADFSVHYMGIHDWSLALIVFVGIGLATLLKLGQQAISQVGVSALVVLTAGAGNYTYGIDRIVDTVIGAIIAVIVNMLILPPDYTDLASQSLEKATREMSGRLQDISEWLNQGASREVGRKLEVSMQQLYKDVHQVEENVDQALRAVRFSPFIKHRCRQLHHLKTQLQYLKKGYVHALEMLRILLEWDWNGRISENDRAEWSQRFSMFSDIVEMWGTSVLNEPYVKQTSQPFLHEAHQWKAKEYVFALYNEAHQMVEDFSKPQL
ncbi:FUSC family protein [Aneurinibacillus terranovensis]|uniref:FUSC family protein n=1 Tax=Aneurinibacillus terranovensis TaxID=278991 RepID=UPI0004058141|nr:aromatic acid exporter family protein [Aneurinibacillus terranovensis]